MASAINPPCDISFRTALRRGRSKVIGRLEFVADALFLLLPLCFKIEFLIPTFWLACVFPKLVSAALDVFLARMRHLRSL